MSVTNLPRSGAAVCITLDGLIVDNTRLSQILVENCDFVIPLHSTPPVGGPHRNIAIRFRIEKYGVAADGEKRLKMRLLHSTEIEGHKLTSSVRLMSLLNSADKMLCTCVIRGGRGHTVSTEPSGHTSCYDTIRYDTIR